MALDQIPETKSPPLGDGRLSAQLTPRPGERPFVPAQTKAENLPLPGLSVSEPLKPGETVQATLMVGGEPRNLYVHAPANYDPKNPAPLILVFNGLGSGADGMEKFTGLSKAGEDKGYVVAYLDGKGTLEHSWNNGQLLFSSHDDQAFVSDALKYLKQDLNIDPKRVFAAGLSQGGSGMLSALPRLDGQFAAVAADETWMTGKEAPLATPTSALVIHGRDDKAAPLSGTAGMLGDGVSRSLGVAWSELKDLAHWDMPAFKRDWHEDTMGTGEAILAVPHAIGPHMEPTQHTVDYFTHADQITTPPLTVQNGSMTVQTYTHGRNGTEVEFITGAGRVHGWGGSSWEGTPIDPPMLDRNGAPVRDTDLIIDFFNRHPKQ